MSGSPHTAPLVAAALSRRLSDRAGVFDIDLQLARGDILGLLGLNGAGKSTTLKLLVGLLRPDSGRIAIAGHDLADNPLAARAALGYLPDNPPLFNDMRVVEYLTLAGKLHKLRGARLNTRLDAVLAQCHLNDRRRQLIGELSKGYRQRVGLAQALIHEPQLVVLDEPGNGLDPEQMNQLSATLKSVAEEAAVIFSTHQLADAQATCTRIAVIHDGRLVADQPSDGASLRSLFTELTAGGNRSVPADHHDEAVA